MPELRKDYFTDTISIVSTEKVSDHAAFKRRREDASEEPCPLCPGNESMTPPADMVLVLREGSLIKLSDSELETVAGWCVRVFPCRSPAVNQNPSSSYSDSPLYSEPAYGYHYIVVATPSHNETFSKISVDQWVNVLAAIQDKVRWLYGRKGVSYVSISLNYGMRAGARYFHPHLEILTLPRLPPRVEQEALAVQKSMYELGVCPMCSVISVESGGPRQILATDFYVAFTPWAPRHPFEFRVFPRRHQVSFLKATQKEIRDLAVILRSTLGGMAKALDDPPFNLCFHTSSEKKTTRQIHWHIEVYPQVTEWTGLEMGGGVHVIPVPPEQSTQIIGSMARKELAEIVGVA